MKRLHISNSYRLKGKRGSTERKENPARRANQSACLDGDEVEVEEEGEDGDAMRGVVGGAGNVLLGGTKTGTRQAGAVQLRMFISR